MFKIIPKDPKAEGDRREQEEPEDLLNKPKFRHEMKIQTPQVQMTEAWGGHRDRGDPQRGSQITFK